MYARKQGSKILTMVTAVPLLALVACGDAPTTGPTTEDFNRERDRVAARLKNKKAKAARPKKAEQTEVAAVTYTIDSAHAFIYDPRGKRDPFRSFEWERPDQVDESELRGPLEQFDVAQLSLVAVVWNTGNARALIEDPSGQSYIIGEGTRIGKNDGRVIDIKDNHVVVKETYVDFLGQETTKDIELRLRVSEGG